VPLGQSAQRGAAQKVALLRSPSDASHDVPGMPVQALHASAPIGRWASSPFATHGTSQVVTVAVLPVPDRKSGLHSRQMLLKTRMKGGHWKQPLAPWSSKPVIPPMPSEQREYKSSSLAW